ncbi:MAG: hypothetical protein ACI9S9_003866, partial [Planctomycetota bacterium]
MHPASLPDIRHGHRIEPSRRNANYCQRVADKVLTPELGATNHRPSVAFWGTVTTGASRTCAPRALQANRTVSNRMCGYSVLKCSQLARQDDDERRCDRGATLR